MSDLSPEELLAFATAEEPTTQEGWVAREAELGQVIIRSDVRPIQRGWEFSVWHPATGRRQRGYAPTTEKSYEAIDVILKEWFGPDNEETKVLRVHKD